MDKIYYSITKDGTYDHCLGVDLGLYLNSKEFEFFRANKKDGDYYRSIFFPKKKYELLHKNISDAAYVWFPANHLNRTKDTRYYLFKLSVRPDENIFGTVTIRVVSGFDFTQEMFEYFNHTKDHVSACKKSGDIDLGLIKTFIEDKAKAREGKNGRATL